MAESVVATSRQETPVYFGHGAETLFGILTRPTGSERGEGVVLLYGGGYNMSANIDQFWARIARRVAAEGFHVLRFDHHGNGDSTGVVDAFDHRHPFDADLEAAVDWMRAQGLDRILLVGDCLGARACLVCAARLESVYGVYAISVVVNDGTMDRAQEWAATYGVRHYVRRALRLSTLRNLRDPVMRKAYAKVTIAKLRNILGLSQEPKVVERMADPEDRRKVTVSDTFLEPVQGALGRGVAIDFVFGVDDEERIARFDDAREEGLGDMLAGAGSLVEITTLPGGLANVPDIEAQDAVVEDVAVWASSRVLRDRSRAREFGDRVS